jgi:protein-S-isoprenylcysteine O-methyltransferase Ste14
VPELALALYLMFLAIAFGWRSWLQWRRTGDLGFRGFSRRASAVERVAEIGFALVIAVFGLLPIGSLLGLVPPIAWLDRPAPHALGALLVGAGTESTVVAQLHMGESWRIGVDASEVTPLVRRGLFAHVRNPIYTGMLSAALGFVLLTPSQLAVANWLLLAAAIELQVRVVEEPYLLRSHGQAYEAWAREVGRFVPGVGRMP